MGFSRLHPLVNLIFFVLVLALTMFVSHPAALAVSLLAAAAFAWQCVGGRHLARQLRWLLPLLLFTALLNPLLTHQGETLLFRFPWGENCTLEAVVFGITAGVRLVAVLLWFVCWNTVLTTDKFVFLFGRILPALALTISMGLCLVPLLLRRYRAVSEAQKCLHPNQRGLRHAGRVIMIVVTWALENALDTADSMKGRGYGLSGRSAFSLYRFCLSDALSLGALLLLGAGVTIGAACGGFSWEYYPKLTGAGGGLTLLSCLFLAALAAFPLILEAKEALQWRASRLNT